MSHMTYPYHLQSYQFHINKKSNEHNKHNEQLDTSITFCIHIKIKLFNIHAIRFKFSDIFPKKFKSVILYN